MTRVVQRRAALVLMVCSLLGCVDCAAAQSAPQTGAEAFILMDAGSGRVLTGKNTEQELAIASTTKIMTALVALETGNLSDKVAVKQNHLKEGSSMYLRAGEVLTLEELLYGLLLPSGNDAAECIADHCSGGVERFVARMNEKAAALGMTHTSFANPSGLDAQGHYSCALDMARLAAYAMREPTFARIAATRTAAVGERMLGNHNKLLASLEGCTGLKTGYTDKAGRTLVTCCERDGMRLIVVTLNDRSDWADRAALYEYGFSAYPAKLGASLGQTIQRAAVENGLNAAVPLVAADSFAWPLAEGETLEMDVELDGTLRAPVRAGDRAGEAVFSVNGTEVGRVALLCGADVAPRMESALSILKQGLPG